MNTPTPASPPPIRYEVSATCSQASLAVFEEVLCAFLSEDAGIPQRLAGALRRDVQSLCVRAIGRPAHPSRLNVASLAISRSQVRSSPFLQVEVTDPGDPTDILPMVPPFSVPLHGWELPIVGDDSHAVVGVVEDEWSVRVLPKRHRSAFWMAGLCRRWAVVQVSVNSTRGTELRIGWPRED